MMAHELGNLRFIQRLERRSVRKNQPQNTAFGIKRMQALTHLDSWEGLTRRERIEQYNKEKETTP
jgi:hypothetical protein